jgi:hypothetical protein
MWTSGDFCDDLLRFDESEHRYTWKGWPMTSVTSFVEAFTRPFDSETMAAKCAKSRGQTKAEILAEWSRSGEVARCLGSRVHAAAENVALSLEGAYSLKTRHPDCGYELAVDNFYRDNPEFIKGWAIPEARVCLPRLGLAGTVDLICSYHGLRAILDFKTSRRIAFTGFNKKMYWPMNQYKDANYFHYSMQLSTYAQILEERHGYDAQFIGIVWLTPCGGHRVYPALRMGKDELDKAAAKFRRKTGAMDVCDLSLDGRLWNQGV